MCFGLAPGFIVQDDLEAEFEELLAEAKAEAETDPKRDTPSFATDEAAAGEALTGSEGTETTGFGGSPK